MPQIKCPWFLCYHNSEGICKCKETIEFESIDITDLYSKNFSAAEIEDIASRREDLLLNCKNFFA